MSGETVLQQGMLLRGNIRHIWNSSVLVALAATPDNQREMLLMWGVGNNAGGVERRLPRLSVERKNMTDQEFQSKLAELMGEISTLPAAERAKLEKLADETRARHQRLRATVNNLQESLDYLRLSIKYLVFDLEATRRENSLLRKMLEERAENE